MSDHPLDPCEVWKAIPFDSKYEASTHGRIRSYNGRNRVIRAVPVILVGEWAGKQPKYLRVILSERRKYSVHRLILLTFVGEPPFSDAQAAHRDGDTANNRPDNLYWATSAENTLDKMRHGKVPRGEGNSRARLRTADVLAIRASSDRDEVLSRQFGVVAGHIANIRARRTWRHV